MRTLTRITVTRSGPSELPWRAWIPPLGPHAFDADGWSHLGPYGDSYWHTWKEAMAFVAAVITANRQKGDT